MGSDAMAWGRDGLGRDGVCFAATPLRLASEPGAEKAPMLRAIPQRYSWPVDPRTYRLTIVREALNCW
jgi:hypothetical protein